jgi:hypothetical protein
MFRHLLKWPPLIYCLIEFEDCIMRGACNEQDMLDSGLDRFLSNSLINFILSIILRTNLLHRFLAGRFCFQVHTRHWHLYLTLLPSYTLCSACTKIHSCPHDELRALLRQASWEKACHYSRRKLLFPKYYHLLTACFHANNNCRFKDTFARTICCLMSNLCTP